MEGGFPSTPAVSQLVPQINFVTGHSHLVLPKGYHDYNYRPGVCTTDLNAAQLKTANESKTEEQQSINLWKLPLTINILQQHLSITRLSRITLPNSIPNEYSGLKVARYRWETNKAQDLEYCPVTDVKISPKTLIIYHSKSLDVGIPQYFVVFGPAPKWEAFELQATRARREDGQDEIHLDIKPLRQDYVFCSERYLIACEFHSTLKPRPPRYHHTFNNFSTNPGLPGLSIQTRPPLIPPLSTTPIPTSATNIPSIGTNLPTLTPSRRRKQAVRANPAVSPASRVSVNRTSNNKPKSRGPRTPMYVDISGEDLEIIERPSTTFQIGGIETRQTPSDSETSDLSSSTSLSNLGFETAPNLKYGSTALTYPAPMSNLNQTRMDKGQQDVEFSPEDSIKKIKQIISNTLPHTQFATILCDFIRVGPYEVLPENGKENGRKLMATVSTEGILFGLPHFENNEVIKDCVIVLNHVRKMQGHLSKKFPILFITVDGKHANWLRENLGMTDAEFCTGDEPELFVMLKLNGEDFSLFHGNAIKRSLPLLEEISEESANSKLLEEASTKSNLQGAKRRKDDSNPVSFLDENGSTPTRPPKFSKSGEVLELACRETPTSAYTGELKKFLMRHTFELSNVDVLSLGEGQYLNDQIIDYWLMEIHSRLSEPLKSKTQIFSAFFYKRLSTASKKKSYSFETDPSIPLIQRKHQRVKKWTKKFDLFSKDFIVVPVNEEAHWYLAIICFPGLEGPHTYDGLEKLEWRNIRLAFPGSQGKLPATVPSARADKGEFRKYTDLEDLDRPRMKQPCILIFDSVNGDNHRILYKNLRDYLYMEYQEKKGAQRVFDVHTFPGYQPMVPLQPNSSDCGIFLLQYAEAFFKNPIYSFALPLHDMVDWFPISVLGTRRQEIYNSILERVKQEAPEHLATLPQLQFLSNEYSTAEENQLPPDNKQESPAAQDAHSADEEQGQLSSQSTQPEEQETTEMEETTEESTISEHSVNG